MNEVIRKISNLKDTLDQQALDEFSVLLHHQDSSSMGLYGSFNLYGQMHDLVDDQLSDLNLCGMMNDL